MTDREQQIRARLKAAREDYRVHVGCGGEVAYCADRASARCHGCDEPVLFGDTVSELSLSATHEDDLTWALAQLDEARANAERMAGAYSAACSELDRVNAELTSEREWLKELRAEAEAAVRRTGGA